MSHRTLFHTHRRLRGTGVSPVVLGRISNRNHGWNIRATLLAVVLACASCATVPSTVSDRLYFGRSIPGGGEVTEAQWNAFVTEMVVPRFPQGFTMWRASGFWTEDNGTPTFEQTSVLEVVHGVDPAVDAKLDEIARAYRQRFNQDAVLRIRTPAEQTLWRR